MLHKRALIKLGMPTQSTSFHIACLSYHIAFRLIPVPTLKNTVHHDIIFLIKVDGVSTGMYRPNHSLITGLEIGW